MKLKIEIDTDLVSNEEFKSVAKRVLYRAMVKMESLAIEKVPVDTGLLKTSINLFPKSEGHTWYELSDGVDYGIHVEYGTRPHWAPIQPLKEWSKRVLGDESAGYAVQHKIAVKGVEAQPFFRPAFDEVKEIWLNTFWE